MIKITDQEFNNFFRIGNFIGKGASAKVFETFHKITNEKYALKVIEIS